MSFAFVFEMALCLFMLPYYFTRKKCYMNMRRITSKQQHKLDALNPANPPP